MYGDLIQLSGYLTARTTWRRVPLESLGGEGAIDEAHLHEVLFWHAGCGRRADGRVAAPVSGPTWSVSWSVTNPVLGQ